MNIRSKQEIIRRTKSVFFTMISIFFVAYLIWSGIIMLRTYEIVHETLETWTLHE